MMNRKEFLHWLATLAASLASTPAAAQSQTLPRRALGRTGVEVPILGLGGHHVGLSGSEKSARAITDAALEEGIRFFDTAESYQNGDSERWLGAALGSRRKDVFLMSKTFALATRDAESAKRHLEGTLQRLRTDHLDLWQLHSVQSVEDVDRAFRPKGAMEYILEMKARKVVRFVGVTGHAQPAANRRALDHYDKGMRFDTMQMPINPLDYHQLSFQRLVLPELTKRGIGVIAMKTSADGRLLRDRVCSIEECLRYVWSLPVSVAVVGMDRPDLVRQNARIARALTPMADAVRRALLARIAPKAELGMEWYKRA